MLPLLRRSHLKFLLSPYCPLILSIHRRAHPFLKFLPSQAFLLVRLRIRKYNMRDDTFFQLLTILFSVNQPVPSKRQLFIFLKKKKKKKVFVKATTPVSIQDSDNDYNICGIN
mmetsp:Transcript_29519/g.43604  ORF Transcript_29519/g.43604 Transcript_29519/m.43604 type:complete len:113 (-) Transcript_29519:61-399(-)